MSSYWDGNYVFGSESGESWVPETIPEEIGIPDSNEQKEVVSSVQGKQNRPFLPLHLRFLSGLLVFGEEIVMDVYTNGIVVVDRSTLLGFWQVAAGASTWVYDKAKGRISHVDDPLYRYLHRMVSTSIKAHGYSREWFMSTDVFLFYCLLYRRPCALAHDLAQYFASAHHR
ncbi:hypothetical protein Hdeb2414_s0024g00649081 [Helianthus debilis subsp. tardiflorus]